MATAVGMRAQTAAERIDEEQSPSSHAHLPPCPCTIYEGFCARRDLKYGGWGKACVSSVESIITMPWQVQCVPSRSGGLNYQCPKLLPQECNPANVEIPCDTSALADCTADECNSGTKLKPFAVRPRHCSLHECTEAECCAKCDCDTDGPDSACCKGRVADEELHHELSCPEEIKGLAGPTTVRLGAYAKDCGFGPADVDYGAQSFSLTSAGKRKICADSCQGSSDLQGAPLDIFADALVLGKECADASLQNQLSPVGIFAAAGELDNIWQGCKRGDVDFSQNRADKLAE